jgi:hypothetical protein
MTSSCWVGVSLELRSSTLLDMPRANHSPYGSARDLPSFQEMARFVRGAKALTLFVARDKRAELIQAEQRLRELTDIVDSMSGSAPETGYSMTR